MHRLRISESKAASRDTECIEREREADGLMIAVSGQPARCIYIIVCKAIIVEW